MDNEMCSICMEHLGNSNRIVTKCNHTFHFLCLKLWLTDKDSCPLCRHFLPIFMSQDQVTRKIFEQVINTDDDDDDTINRLLSQININEPDSSGFTYLMTMCIHSDNFRYVEYFLNNSADPNVQDTNGNTALIHSVIRNNENAFHTLLNFAVDIYIKNTHGYDAIYFAVEAKNINMVSALLDRDVNLVFNRYDNDKITLLHIAVLMGCGAITRLFLNYITTTTYGYTDIAELLLSNGSNNQSKLDVVLLFMESGLSFTKDVLDILVSNPYIFDYLHKNGYL